MPARLRRLAHFLTPKAAHPRRAATDRPCRRPRVPPRRASPARPATASAYAPAATSRSDPQAPGLPPAIVAARRPARDRPSTIRTQAAPARRHRYRAAAERSAPSTHHATTPPSPIGHPHAARELRQFAEAEPTRPDRERCALPGGFGSGAIRNQASSIFRFDASALRKGCGTAVSPVPKRTGVESERSLIRGGSSQHSLTQPRRRRQADAQHATRRRTRMPPLQHLSQLRLVGLRHPHRAEQRMLDQYLAPSSRPSRWPANPTPPTRRGASAIDPAPRSNSRASRREGRRGHPRPRGTPHAFR